MIRVELRKQKRDYRESRVIAEDIALKVILVGSSAIIDSDFNDPKKRASLEKRAREAGARVVYVCVYASLDIMIGRTVLEASKKIPDPFWSKATTGWRGNKRLNPAVVRVREMVRRMPHHYDWDKNRGGVWSIKRPPKGLVVADINTSDSKKWQGQVERLGQKLLQM